MSTTTTTLVTSGTPWHPQSFADLSKRLQSEPEAVSHDVDFTFQALAMRSQTQQTTITQINNIINGKGTVSSVALAMPSIFGVAGSPITTSGTLAVTLLAETANLVWAGPSSGPAAPPTFRALVAGDIPALPYLPSTTVLPQTITKLAHQWLDSYSATTGLFTQSQPAIADLSDAANVVQTSRTISTTLPLTGGGDLSANRTLASNTFTGDSGSGGLQGDVPAPAAGDAAAGKFLKADGTWTTPAGSGTVTSVALTAPAEFSIAGSPVTTSGTLAITKANENANTVWAGPTTGSPAQPTFRSVVTADLPYTYSGNTTKLGTVAAGSLTSGHIATWDASGNLQDGGAPGGTGTVTSVAMTVPTGFTVTGSPVTTSGTLAVTADNESANTVWAGPTTGAAATPAFRTLVAADIPAIPSTETDVTSSRAINGTVYHNTGTKPLFVQMWCSKSTTGNVQIFSDTTTTPTRQIAGQSLSNGFVGSFFFVVPAGSYYKATVNTGSATVNLWLEYSQ